MSDNRDNKKLVWNESIPIKTHGRSWDIGNCIQMTVEGYRGYMLETSQPTQQRSVLQTNFFSTELMDVSLDDEEGLLRFMGTYGLLDCPKRHFSTSLEAALGASIPLGGTDAARRAIEKDNHKYFESKGSISKPSSVYQPSHFVTREEALAILTVLQNTVSGLFSVLDTRELKNPMLFDFVNLNASNETQISYAIERAAKYGVGINFEETPNIGSLASAISNQIIETIADNAPWYKCKAPDCERWFKRKRGKERPRTNSEYCSQRCSERTRKRKQRNPTGPSTQ